MTEKLFKTALGVSAPWYVAGTDFNAQARKSGSHKTLSRPGWPDFVFAFHDGETIGPKMLARI